MGQWIPSGSFPSLSFLTTTPPTPSSNQVFGLIVLLVPKLLPLCDFCTLVSNFQFSQLSLPSFPNVAISPLCHYVVQFLTCEASMCHTWTDLTLNQVIWTKNAIKSTFFFIFGKLSNCLTNVVVNIWSGKEC